MSMRDCILQAVDEGRLSEGKAGETLALYDELAADLSNTMHASAAEVEAGRMAYESMRHEIAEKKRRELLRIKTWQRLDMQMRQYRNGRGEEDFGAAMLAHIDRDDLAHFSNIEARRKAVLGRMHAGMDQFLATFRRNMAGDIREKAQLDDVVRELFGTDTRNQAAKDMAAAWSHTAEWGRKRFNAAGGRIPKRKDWGMPQTHDSVAVGKASFNEWRDFILPRLDVQKMVDERSGLPFTSTRMEMALREVYDTIRTEGLNKLTPSGAAGGRSLANRHMDHRFLVFKDADGWIEYNGRFGGSDPFSVMMSHLDSMARDISAMEILGPNPQSTLRFMEQTARKWSSDAGKQETLLKSVEGQIKLAWDMYGLYSGSTNAPINGKLGRTMAGTRQTLQAIQLGAAALSSVTDLNTGRIARAYSGLPQRKMIGQIARLLNPADLADQKLAVRLGLIADNWSTIAAGQMRYVGDISGPEISRRLADVVMRASGLSAWTQAGRWAFGMEFMGAMADHAGKAFDELPKPLSNTFKRYGIDGQRWDVMRASPLYDADGAVFLRPEDIAGRADLAPGFADDLALRLLEMIQSETEFAVPSTSLRGRANLLGDVQPGTVQGELLRSVAMYKSFAMTFYHTHITRMALQNNPANMARYAANLFISTTLMGGLSIQLKEIAKGRDPRPMNSPEFWGAALLQGGGLGIFGDFLGASTTNRMGGGLGSTIAGPVISAASDVINLTAGNLFELARGDETNFGRDVSNFIRRYTPGGSLWYARLAFERMVVDEIQKAIDPDALDRFRRMESRYKSEHGQGYWWRPGEMLPDRGADISNIAGEK